MTAGSTSGCSASSAPGCRPAMTIWYWTCCWHGRVIRPGDGGRALAHRPHPRARRRAHHQSARHCRRGTVPRPARTVPDWLVASPSAGWASRYGHRVEESRQPKDDAERLAFAEVVAALGTLLLALLDAVGARGESRRSACCGGHGSSAIGSAAAHSCGYRPGSPPSAERIAPPRRAGTLRDRARRRLDRVQSTPDRDARSRPPAPDCHRRYQTKRRLPTTR
jgi:hypothetical protein